MSPLIADVTGQQVKAAAAAEWLESDHSIVSAVLHTVTQPREQSHDVSEIKR